MPGAYPRTSTIALTNTTLPYVRKLASIGLQALKQDSGFGKGLNTHLGKIICQPVAIALAYEDLYKPLGEIY
jgi:alanine dehydrogenase